MNVRRVGFSPPYSGLPKSGIDNLLIKAFCSKVESKILCHYFGEATILSEGAVAAAKAKAGMEESRQG